MSLPSVKWIPGAPKQLKVGMVLKAGAEVNLIGTADVDPEFGAKGVVFDDLLSELQGGSA